MRSVVEVVTGADARVAELFGAAHVVDEAAAVAGAAHGRKTGRPESDADVAAAHGESVRGRPSLVLHTSKVPRAAARLPRWSVRWTTRYLSSIPQPLSVAADRPIVVANPPPALGAGPRTGQEVCMEGDGGSGPRRGALVASHCCRKAEADVVDVVVAHRAQPRRRRRSGSRAGWARSSSGRRRTDPAVILSPAASARPNTSAATSSSVLPQHGADGRPGTARAWPDTPARRALRRPGRPEHGGVTARAPVYPPGSRTRPGSRAGGPEPPSRRGRVLRLRPLVGRDRRRALPTVSSSSPR